MAEDETRVVYKAVADYSSVFRQIAKLKKELASLKAAETAFNSSSATGAKKAQVARTAAFAAWSRQLRAAKTNVDKTKAAEKQYNASAVTGANAAKKARLAAFESAIRKGAEAKKAIQEAASADTTATRQAVSNANKRIETSASVVEALQSEGLSVDQLTGEVTENTAAVDENETSQRNLHRTVGRGGGIFSAFRNAMQSLAGAVNGNSAGQVRFSRNVGNSSRALGNLSRAGNATRSTMNSLVRSMEKFGNFRPKLVPPFIALIPIVASLLALINPLVAMIGALGGAAIGAASSLGSLSGILLGIVPALAAAASGVAALVVAFKGIGGVFSAYSQFTKQKARGGGGGGGGGLSEAERLQQARAAQERYTDAIIAAKKAQEDLTDARKTALRNLQDLRREVEKAGASEADAAASVQLAQENLYNILADPGSTAGEKAKALAELTDAENELIDTRAENVRNAEDLAEAEKKGIEGSDEVVAAKKRELDALRELRDAQEALNKQQKGSGGGGGGAASALDAYQEALDKLSPSARAVVLALIGMSGAFKEVQQAVQEAFFSQFVDDIGLLEQILPGIRAVLVSAGTSLGRFVEKVLKLYSSPKILKDFNILAGQSGRILDSMGDAVVYILEALNDLAIIAGPLMEGLATDFANSSREFRDLMSATRESGNLADWLETVRERLSKWWQVVKNIGLTIFNYSSAASEFGDWILEGFVAMTEGWVTASEGAKKDGSPFKIWLEDIKPLLLEIKGLFGAAFVWFSSTASDPKNIESAVNLLRTIRDELGPSVARILQTLTDAGIDEAFVRSLASIVSSVDSLLKAGGDKAFIAFFNTLEKVFTVISDILDSPGAGKVLAAIAEPLGVIAALTFVGKFTGLFALFGWLQKLSGNSGVLNLLSGLKNLKGLGIGGVGGLGTGAGAGGVAGVGGAAAGGAAAAAPAVGIAAAVLVAAGSLTNSVIEMKALLEPGGSFEEFKKNPTKENRETLQTEMSASAVKSAFPVAGATQIFLDTFFPALGAEFDSFFLDIGANLAKAFSTVFSSVLGGLGRLGEIFANPGKFLNEVGAAIQIWANDLAYNIGVWAGNVFRFIMGVGPWLAARWAEFVKWFGTLGPAIGKIAGNVWNFIVNLGPWLAARWTEFSTWITGLPDKISKAAGDIWKSITGIGAWLGKQATAVTNWISDTLSGIFKNFWAGFTDGANGNPPKPPSKNKKNKKNQGGVIRKYASGGGVPGQGSGGGVPGQGSGDTVPAMLTPGEYVIKKSIVSKYGMEALNQFNGGVLTLAGLIQSQKKSGSRQGGNFGDVSFMASGGPVYSGSSFGGTSSSAMLSSISSAPFIGEVNIYNAVPETSSESLPKAIRKTAYLAGRRP